MQETISKSWIEINKEYFVLGLFILARLAMGVLPPEYGYHRDELYYIALSHHLDWGYLGTVPPLLPFCLAILRYTIGNSLFAIHLFTAVIGALTLFIAWLMVCKMSGKLFSQTLMLACLTFAPFYINISSKCQYVCPNVLFWTLALYFIVLLLASGNKKYWIYFGVAAGLGLMSKLDMLWLGAGITAAMILTSQRKYFLAWQFWAGGIIAFLIALPFFVWMALHAPLVMEFLKKYGTQVQPMTILTLIKVHIMDLNPITFPIWLTGLWYFLFNKQGKRFRLLGFAYFIVLILCIVMHAKSYFSVPYYVVLLAGGSVALEVLFDRISVMKYISSVYIGLIILVGLVLVPLARPVLPIPLFLKYLKIIDMDKPEIQSEKHVKPTIIPQDFSDRFGWEELSAKIAGIYNFLPEEEKKNAVIVAENWGQASALEFYKEKYNLPLVICGHNQYYLWKPKNLPDNTVVISIEREGVKGPEKVLNDVKQVGVTHSEYGIYYENNIPICVSKDFKIPPEKALQSLKLISM